MNTAILSAIGAGYVWLFYYAYKHPKAYSKRGPYLTAIIFIVYAGFLCWSIAILKSYEILTKYIPPDKQSIAKTALDGISLDTTYLLLILVVTNLYMFGLAFLHSILGIENETGTKEK